MTDTLPERMNDAIEVLNGMDMRPQHDFQIGQIWIDGNDNAFTVIALTDYPRSRVVVQSRSGAVWGHGENGEWDGETRAYDLVRCISTPTPDTAEFVRNHGQEVA